MISKRIRELIQKLKELFLKEIIEKMGKKTKFIQRRGKLTPEAFASLCIFNNNDLCTSSLSELCCKLEINNNISISEEGLNERFNEKAVTFMQEILKEMFKKQNEILRRKEHHLKLHFNRINVTDSTSFDLPDEFKQYYKGSGGSASSSAIRIQLEYNIITGEFLNCDLFDGVSSDINYLTKLQEGIRENDLCLKDLGYFKIEHIEEIDGKHAFYISKVRSNVNVYIKNQDDRKGYALVDLSKLVEPLAEGEILEIPEVYIGKGKKIKSRLILTKLSEKSKEKRQRYHKKRVAKGKGAFSEKGERWYSTNAYITNIPVEILDTNEVHDVYSLRWQIELMFKIWKSVFKINMVKRVKIERFKCTLYGKLISLLLASSIVFTAKDIIHENSKKEISPIKSFKIVKEYFNDLSRKLFKGEIAIANIINQIIGSILKHGIKSKRKGKKTPFMIFQSIKISDDEFTELTG